MLQLEEVHNILFQVNLSGYEIYLHVESKLNIKWYQMSSFSAAALHWRAKVLGGHPPCSDVGGLQNTIQICLLV